MQKTALKPAPGWLKFPLVLALLFGVIACGDSEDDANDESTPTDSLQQVADSLAADSLMPDSLAVDSTVFLPVAAAVPDTVVVVDTVYVDTLSAGSASSGQVALAPGLDLEALEARLDRIDATLEKLVSGDEDQEAKSDTISTTSPRDTLESAADNLSNFGLKLFVSLIFLFVTYLTIRIVVWVLDTASERSASRRLFFKKLIPIVRIVAWSFVIYLIVAKVFNVDSQGLLAAGAALGVAVGFAAQDVLKNIFGGILIILDQPFQVGDKISVAGTYGEVVSIGLRSTRIVTPDDNLVSVPNTQVVDGQVANANAGALHCQVVTTLYLPGNVDVDVAKRIAYEAAANSMYVYLDKPIVVLVKDHFEYEFITKIVVKAYVLDTRFEFVFSSEITETAKSEYLRLGLLADSSDTRTYEERSGTATYETSTDA